MGEWFAKRTLGMLPAEAARRWGGREALVFKDKRWTYGEFSVEVDRIACALIALGVRPGEHVALWITNRPEFLFLFYAIAKVGAIVIPLNTRYRTLDLGYALRHSRCVTLVTMERSGPVEFGTMALEVLGPLNVMDDGTVRSSACPALRRLVILERSVAPGVKSWAEFVVGGCSVSEAELSARAAAVDPDGVATIMYTSGTTDHPKGVMLNHSGVRLAVYRAMQMGITCMDVTLNYLPLFHLYGVGYAALQCMVTGSKQILTETFDADEALRLIEAERVTVLYGLDTHYRDLIEAKKRAPATDLGSLRVGSLSSGLESVAELAIQTQRLLCPTVSGYGMTETWSGVVQSALDANLDQRSRSSGYPLPTVEIRVVDPATGAEVATGVQGEVLIRSSCNMMGYFDNPDATAKAIDGDGWLHTGDAGMIRPDGHLRVIGRYKDMLRIGGENVAPAEIEHLLLQMPGVARAAVLGCPDARLHEVAAAFIVPHAGAVITREMVETFCRGKIASYKIPRQVILVGDLPMTPSGKIQKNLLRERLDTGS